MTEISAKLVKELRDRTGAGMMECKRALVETNGDIDAAVELLRKWGAASAEKRAGRDTTEGVVLSRVENGLGAIVGVGCETEPVSKNEEFRAFAERVLATTFDGGDSEALEDRRVELVGKIGENIAVVGTARFAAVDGGVIDVYVHPPANKLGVLVQVRGGSQGLGRRLAMHIAASSPRWIAREDVPGDIVTSEREIYLNSDEVQGKPEHARDKIVEGMLDKRFFAAQVLTEQVWIHDTAKTVGQALQEEDAAVLEFERLALG